MVKEWLPQVLTARYAAQVDDPATRQGVQDMNRLTRLLRDIRGATAIEYGLIAALIAIAAISAMSTLGGKVSTTFNNVSDNLK